MKSKTTHKKQVYNKHNINIYKVINSKTKKVNTIKSKSNKTRKVKKHYNRQQLELHNGGGMFDSILPFGLNKRVRNFISNATLVDTLYNKLINNKQDTSTLKDKIYNFIFNVLKKFYYLLKSNKALFTGDNYKKYNHKKVFKYNDNNYSNDIIIDILTNFINLLLPLSLSNIGTSIYPLINGSQNYGYSHLVYRNNQPSSDFEFINTYFQKHTMTETNIIEYIKAIIEYDKTIIKRPYSSSTYLLRNNKDHKFKYANLLYITQNKQSQSSNRTNINTIFLIIYKKFSSTQLKMSFTYDQNLSHDDFYVLENKFLKLKTELINIGADPLKKLVNKYDDIIFNSKNANLYGEFLFYYYKSFAFSNQK